MPAADVPPRSRLRGVLIFEQSGALASTPCAFRFQSALEPIFESAFLKCYAIMNSGSEIGLPGRISIGFYLDKHQNGPVRPAPGKVFDLKCRSCGRDVSGMLTLGPWIRVDRLDSSCSSGGANNQPWTSSARPTEGVHT